MAAIFKRRLIPTIAVFAVALVLGVASTVAALGAGTPTVTSINPLDGAVVNTSTVPIRLDVTDPNGISDAPADYYIKVNGTPITASFQYDGYWEEETCSGTQYFVITNTNVGHISGTATGLRGGVQNVEVMAKNKQGVSVVQAWSFSVSAPPSFTVMSPANGTTTVNNSTISVQTAGNVNPDSIALTVDGSPVQSSFDPLTGVISHIAQSPLSDGLHNITVTAADSAGTGVTSSWSYTVAATGPQITFADAGKTFATATPALAVWLKSSVNLDSSSASMTVDGQPVAGTFTFRGHWDYPMELDPVYIIESYKEAGLTATPAPLRDGPHTLAVTAKDSLGNITTTQFSFTVSTKPAFSAAYPANKANTTDNKGFSVKVSDVDGINTTSVAVYLDGGLVPAVFDPATSLISYVAAVPLADGPHKVDVSAADTNGSTANFSWSFTVQTAGPAVTFADDGKTMAIHNSTISVALKSFVRIDSGVVMTIDGQTVPAVLTYKGHWEYPLELDPEWVVDSYAEATLTYLQSFSDGPHQMSVTAKDILGNISTKAFSFTISQPPVFTGLTPADGTTVSSKTPTVSVSIADPNGPAVDKAGIRLTIDNNQVVPTLTDGADGEVKVTYTTSTLAADNYHNISITAADTAAAPNTSSASWKFYINNKGDMAIDAKSCSSCHTLNQYNKYVHTEGPLNIGVGHSSPTHFYGNSCEHCHSGYNEKTCGYCHNGDISLWWDGDGWVRPQPVPDPAISAGQDCLYCHSGNNGGWVPSPYAAYHFYWVKNIINTGVEPFEPPYSDLNYTLRHDILPLHKIEKGSCNNCHSAYLTREHNRLDSSGNQITCATCHSSTDPKVQQAIAANNRDCLACHASADHESVHQDTLDSNCQTCHAATLTQEHLNNSTTASRNYTCDTCHSSTAKEVRRSIASGNIGCAGCHPSSPTHKVLFADKVPADIPLYAGYQWTLPIEASIFTGEANAPAGYDSGQIVLSNRRADVTVSGVWSFYNAGLTGAGWTLSSSAPAAGADYFSAEFAKEGRRVVVRCYNTTSDDGTGAPSSGYRIALWYK